MNRLIAIIIMLLGSSLAHAVEAAGAEAPAGRCEDFLLDLPSPHPHIFSPSGKLSRFQSLRGDRAMIYDYKSARPRAPWQKTLPVVIFLHGLGDNLFELEQQELRAERAGFGILRVDQHLHGETFKDYLRTHNNQVPERLDYTENSIDVVDLVKSLNITSVVVDGHSMGGGVGTDLAARLKALGAAEGKIKCYGLVYMAGYGQRVDKYIATLMKDPQFLIDKTADALEKSGMDARVVKNIFMPLSFFVTTMFKNIEMMTKVTDQYRKAFEDVFTAEYRKALDDAIKRWESAKDQVMDPTVLEPFMRKTFRKYFVMMSGKDETNLDASELQFIDLKVKAAIAVTKGLRSLDILDKSVPLPDLPPVLIIGGENDQLVVPQQLKDFAERLKEAGIRHRLVFLRGEDAHHLFPKTMPIETWAHAFDFIMSEIATQDAEDAKAAADVKP